MPAKQLAFIILLQRVSDHAIRWEPAGLPVSQANHPAVPSGAAVAEAPASQPFFPECRIERPSTAPADDGVGGAASQIVDEVVEIYGAPMRGIACALV